MPSLVKLLPFVLELSSKNHRGGQNDPPPPGRRLIKYPLSIILINFAGNEEMAAKTTWIRSFYFVAGPSRFKVSPVSGAAAGGHVISSDVIDIFTSQVPYFDLHRPSLDPSHSFVNSYVGTAVLWVADLLTLQTGRALTAAGLRCSLLRYTHSTHPSPPLPAGSATTRRPGINKLSAASASPPAGPPWWWFSQQPKRDRSATWWRGKILFRPTVPNGVEIHRVVMLTSHKITILIGHNANLTRV